MCAGSPAATDRRAERAHGLSTVLRQYEGDSARICARSMTEMVRILVPDALSHLECPYDLGIARLAQRRGSFGPSLMSARYAREPDARSKRL